MSPQSLVVQLLLVTLASSATHGHPVEHVSHPRKHLRWHVRPTHMLSTLRLFEGNIPILDDMRKAWEKTSKKALENARRPLMSGINVLRVEMCWNRPNLMQHEKCLKFLGIMCSEQSTGQNICKDFAEDVKHACEHRTPGSESEHLQKTRCDVAKTLDPDVNDPMDDLDGDGVVNHKDKFPNDPNEWSDLDGDGIGDNADPDRDGDGYANGEDKFPNDVQEWSDMDGDGIGDNSDPDRDGDGYANEQDSHPDDPTRPGGEAEKFQQPQDVEEIVEAAPAPAPASAVDSDGDGVPDSKDAFPNDANAWLDSDGDGHGDNGDFFPHEASEWADSDGDGIGDNADQYPLDPNCHSDPCVTHDGGLAPAAAPFGRGVAPAASDGEPEKRSGVVGGTHKVVEAIAPWHLNKLKRGLPEQGYDEHSFGKIAEHNDMLTSTRDWGGEWPQYDESEDESVQRMCARHPNNSWCKRFAVNGRFAR